MQALCAATRGSRSKLRTARARCLGFESRSRGSAESAPFLESASGSDVSSDVVASRGDRSRVSGLSHLPRIAEFQSAPAWPLPLFGSLELIAPISEQKANIRDTMRGMRVARRRGASRSHAGQLPPLPSVPWSGGPLHFVTDLDTTYSVVWEARSISRIYANFR